MFDDREMALDEGFFQSLAALDRPDDAEYLYDESTEHGALRLRNLRRYFGLMQAAGSTTLLLAEAPGWRGMTVTGIPFTSVKQLLTRPGLITAGAEGDGFELPADPPALWEASSAVVWNTIAGWTGPPPTSWPVYPHHPFERGNPLTNRTPRPAEVRGGTAIALHLADALGIELIVSVGRKAQAAMLASGVETIAVRHPAQGGAAIFARQLAELNARS
ncbi:MAG: hypothetical protein JWN80_997 [Microbacteriaceae bacterium]|nr:hypothetical protein [Microbacteriaceae bacterium]